MRATYTLNDGREIVLRELRQWFTHEGVLEGRPSPQMNGDQLNNLVRRHQRDGRGVSLFLGKIDSGRRSEAFPFGTPAELLSITCTARFVSYSPTHNSQMMCSELTLIWFQTDFWVQSEFAEAMARIDWEEHAWDYDI